MEKEMSREMKKFLLFLMYLAAFILQSTLLKHFMILGTGPDLILALTIVYSFFFEDFYAAGYGLLAGLLQDICFSPAVGLSALIYFLVGVVLQLLRIGVYRDNKFILLIITAVFSAVYYVGLWLLAEVFLESDINIAAVLIKIPVAVVWNYICVILAYMIARKDSDFIV